MKFIATILLTLTLTIIKAEVEAIDGNREKPQCCPRGESCGSKCDKEQRVTALQHRLQKFVAECDYRSALELAIPDATYATVDPGCPGMCCYDAGSIQDYYTFFTCNDQIIYPAEPVKITHLANGTIIYSATEMNASSDGILSAYYNNYYWFPQADCSYLLGYIDGNSYNCPAYLPGAPPCFDCGIGKK